MAIRKFHRGSATFPCSVCRRLTRDTGVQSAGTKICPQCYELAGIENRINDGRATLAEYRTVIDEYIHEIVAEGGDVTTWTKTLISPETQRTISGNVYRLDTRK